MRTILSNFGFICYNTFKSILVNGIAHYAGHEMTLFDGFGKYHTTKQLVLLYGFQLRTQSALRSVTALIRLLISTRYEPGKCMGKCVTSIRGALWVFISNFPLIGFSSTRNTPVRPGRGI